MKIKNILLIIVFFSAFLFLAGNTNVYAMQINIMYGGSTFALEVESGDSIENVKQKIQKEREILPEKQLLFYTNKKLNDDRTLADYNIQKQSYITLYQINSDKMEYVINSIEPQDENEAMFILENFTEKEEIIIKEFKSTDFTKAEGFDLTFYYTDLNFSYKYDENIKNKIDKIVANLPEGKDTYSIEDLELINYWSNGGMLHYYSSELMSYINNKNFEIDYLYGDDGLLYTESMGFANFKYNGTTYFITQDFGISGEHVLYVPTDTADSELMNVIQERINNYIGKDKATIKDCGNKEAWKKIIGEEEYNQLEAGDLLGALNKSSDGHVYSFNIGDTVKYFVISKDSSKMCNTTCKTSDILTDVSISTENGTVPLDAIVKAKEITNGEEYNKILKILKVTNNEMFDLKLFSSALDEYITKLQDSSFEVKIPISEELQGKELVIYYVEDENKVEYPVKVEENYAIFNTNHFSIYTLAEKAKKYEVIEGANQIVKLNTEDVTFKIDADYTLFNDEVYIDDELVDSKNYTSKSGSTIITFNKEYINTLEIGKHSLKVAFENAGEAITEFTIEKQEENTKVNDTTKKDESSQEEKEIKNDTENKEEKKTNNKQETSNPKTGDNIIVYTVAILFEIIGLVAITFIRKKK